MSDLCLHHVSIPVRDLAVSAAFYEEVFGLSRIERPQFGIPGVWFGCGDRQLHLVVNAAGTFRKSRVVDIADVHFAFRVADFEAMVSRLEMAGFGEDRAEDDPRRLLVIRDGVAGFPQLYLLDPDWNTVEVNGAPM